MWVVLECEDLAREKVAAGVAWLTERHGGNWWVGINWDLFDIDDSELCVLGQLYGSYWRFFDGDWWRQEGDRWGGSYRFFAVDHGFVAACLRSGNPGDWSCDALGAVLNREWRSVAVGLGAELTHV